MAPPVAVIARIAAPVHTTATQRADPRATDGATEACATSACVTSAWISLLYMLALAGKLGKDVSPVGQEVNTGDPTHSHRW
jgi:hypothetical protein